MQCWIILSRRALGFWRGLRKTKSSVGLVSIPIGHIYLAGRGSRPHIFMRWSQDWPLPTAYWNPVLAQEGQLGVIERKASCSKVARRDSEYGMLNLAHLYIVIQIGIGNGPKRLIIFIHIEWQRTVLVKRQSPSPGCGTLQKICSGFDYPKGSSSGMVSLRACGRVNYDYSP